MSMVEWPHNKKCAVLISFDVDGEAPYIYKKSDYVQITRGLYGMKVGLPRILKLLEELKIKATFFVCGYLVNEHSLILKEILRKGHEIACHGYLHEDYSRLSKEEALMYLDKAMSSLEKLEINVKGFRAPYWRFNKWLLEILAKQGILWDSSLMDSDFPYIIELNKRRIVELPVSYILDDWIVFEEKYITYDDVLKIWTYEYEGIAEEGGIFVLTMHPAVIGRKARLNILRELLIRIIKDKRAWLATGSEIANWVLQLNKLVH